MRIFDIPNPELDNTRKMFGDLEKDKRDSKIDLGIGIYRDENGLAPVFRSIKQAEKTLYDLEDSKSYKTPAGNLRSVSYTHLTLPTTAIV